MINKLRNYIYSGEHSLERKRFSLVCLIAEMGVISVLVAALTGQESPILDGILIASMFIIYGLWRYTMRTGRYSIGGAVILFMSNIIILPVGYLLGGGAYSGSGIWLVLGVAVIFVLFRGRMFGIYLIASFAAFGAAIYAGAKYPDLVVPLKDIYSIHQDIFVSVFCVGLSVGLLFYLQSEVLETEVKRAEKQKEEISKLNDMQSNFFASMSHEIRTPINTIIGLNEMTMREKGLPEDIQENTINIQNASKILLSLINDLLDMSKIQSGKMEIVPAEYDASRMLSEITNLHWNRAMEKGLHFDVQVSENLPHILYGDENRIKQVIINLISNAIKYTDEGFVTVRFGGEINGPDQFLLQVEVEDSGMGIRKENIPYLFDSFRRVEGGETKNIEGTGLGLSIAKQLVDLMSGNITVNSIYTKGSVFRIEIPQGTVTTGMVGAQTPGILSGTNQEYQHSFEAPEAKVLIVDDNDMNRIVCQKLLRSTKVQVDLAASGRECLEMTISKHYDAILMDHEMPQMDGIETLHKLRQQNDGLCRDTPVIALTANAGSDRNAFYVEQGFSAYLAKPIQSARLEALLLACLPEDMIEQHFTNAEEEAIHISETVHKIPFVVTTDSICDLPEDILSSNEIKVMPYYIVTDQGRFRDLSEIDADNLQEFTERNENVVFSDPAPIEEYEEFFGDALTEARYVLHLSPCKDISRAYQNASIAAGSFGNVEVIDSGHISTGLGMMALKASELFRSGLRMDEVVEELKRYSKQLSMNYLVPYMDRSNTKYRASLPLRIMTGVFNTEPIFSTKKGRIVVKKFLLGYVRSTPDQFIRYCLKNRAEINTEKLYVTFSCCKPEFRKHVLDEISKIIEFDEVIANKASASTFSNCGPSSFGLIFEKRGGE